MGIEIENKKKREKLVLGWIPQLWPNSPFSPAALSAQNPNPAPHLHPYTKKPSINQLKLHY